MEKKKKKFIDEIGDIAEFDEDSDRPVYIKPAKEGKIRKVKE